MSSLLPDRSGLGDVISTPTPASGRSPVRCSGGAIRGEILGAGTGCLLRQLAHDASVPRGRAGPGEGPWIHAEFDHIGLHIFAPHQRVRAQIHSMFRGFPVRHIYAECTASYRIYAETNACLGLSAEAWPQIDGLRSASGAQFFAGPMWVGAANHATKVVICQIGTMSQDATIVAFRHIVSLLSRHASGSSFLCHGAGVADAGLGYLFIGPSGAGKTTVARRSTEQEVLGDECVVVRRSGGRVAITGAPFGDLPGSNRTAPLRAVLCLVKGNAVHATRLSEGEGFVRLLRSQRWAVQDFGHPHGADAAWQDTLGGVPMFDLMLDLTTDFWGVVRQCAVN